MWLHTEVYGRWESARKVESGRSSAFESGRKIPCRTGELNLHQRHAGPTLYQLSYNPSPPLQPPHAGPFWTPCWGLLFLNQQMASLWCHVTVVSLLIWWQIYSGDDRAENGAYSSTPHPQFWSQSVSGKWHMMWKWCCKLPEIIMFSQQVIKQKRKYKDTANK